jgi:hypothetical protein
MGLGARPDASKFFTLAPLAENGDDRAGGGATRLWLGLGPIVLPGYLERTQLVRRVGPNEVKLAESDRWAEPLAEGVAHTLQRNLTVLLGAERVVLHPWSLATRVDLRVDLEVLRFEPAADGGAELKARWTVRDGTGTRLLAARESQLTEPPSGRETAAAVAAMSRALGGLSTEIARAVREHVPAKRAP